LICFGFATIRFFAVRCQIVNKPLERVLHR
jgi:hypothetical protein